MARRSWKVFALVAATFWNAACGVAGLAGVQNSHPSPPPITRIALAVNVDDKTGYHLPLSIAGTFVRGFLFDTGSGGLWVYANAIAHPKNSIRDLHIQTSNKYGSGLYYKGDAIETTVDFGNNLPVVTVPLVRVTDARCLTDSCEKKYGTGNVIDRLEKERGLWGTFGADLEPKPIAHGKYRTDIYNVLFALGKEWTRFAIVPDEIDAAPSLNDFTTIAMTSGPPTHAALPNGAKSWDRDVPVCFRIGDAALTYAQCLPTVFDTGASGVSFRTTDATKLPWQQTKYCGRVLKAETPFATLTKGGAKITAFAAGVTQNWNEVKLETPSPSQSPQVNTGLTFYNRNELAFDAVRGLVGLQQLDPPQHKFESECDATPSLTPFAPLRS